MWNAKVKCIDVWSNLDRRGFEVDKIYHVSNGKLIFPDGTQTHSTYSSIEELNESFYAVFKEVKECK